MHRSPAGGRGTLGGAQAAARAEVGPFELLQAVVALEA